MGVVINQLMRECAYYNYFISRKQARVATSKATMRHIQVYSSVLFSFLKFLLLIVRIIVFNNNVSQEISV